MGRLTALWRLVTVRRVLVATLLVWTCGLLIYKEGPETTTLRATHGGWHSGSMMPGMWVKCKMWPDQYGNYCDMGASSTDPCAFWVENPMNMNNECMQKCKFYCVNMTAGPVTAPTYTCVMCNNNTPSYWNIINGPHEQLNACQSNCQYNPGPLCGTQGQIANDQQCPQYSGCPNGQTCAYDPMEAQGVCKCVSTSSSSCNASVYPQCANGNCPEYQDCRTDGNSCACVKRCSNTTSINECPQANKWCKTNEECKAKDGSCQCVEKKPPCDIGDPANKPNCPLNADCPVGQSCKYVPTLENCRCSTCGNGVKDAGEACDAGQGCKATENCNNECLCVAKGGANPPPQGQAPPPPQGQAPPPGGAVPPPPPVNGGTNGNGSTGDSGNGGTSGTSGTNGGASGTTGGSSSQSRTSSNPSSNRSSSSTSSTGQVFCPRPVCGDGLLGAISTFDCPVNLGARAHGTFQVNSNRVCVPDGQYTADGKTTNWTADGEFGTGNSLSPLTTSFSDTWKGTLCATGIGCRPSVSPFTLNIPQRTLTGEMRFDQTYRYSCNLISPTLEECDDGDKDNNDGCSSTCKLEFCGDASVQRDLRVITLDEALSGQGSNRNLFEQCDNGSVCDNNLSKKCRNHTECGTGKCVFDTGKDPNCSNLCQRATASSSTSTSSTSSRSSSSSSACLPPGNCSQCATCGTGIFNVCDQKECLELGPCAYTERFNLGKLLGVCVPDPTFCDTSIVCRSSSSSSSSSSSRSSTGSSLSSSKSSSRSSSTSRFLVSPPAPVVPVPPPPVSVPICGDGFLDQGEECDDGNHIDTDACSNRCTLKRCGDSVLQSQSGEECDDGNRIDEDACNNNCTFKRSSSSRVSSRSSSRVSSSSSVTPYCSDGLLTIDEECDDGNTRDFDGCSSLCLLEFGFCGDSILQKGLGEMCEPRLHDPSLPYACTSDCLFLSPFCGDSKLDAGEQCDAGQRNSDLPDSLCRENCSLPRCGDGILDTREQCDDKNLLNGDGCDRLCHLEYSAPPLARVVPSTPPVHPPVGDTGPATLAIMAAGASAGMGWVRRRRKG